METHILDRYNSASGAASYRKKFSKHWTERINNVREQRLLERLLRTIPQAHLSGLVLDMPSGYSRLFPLLRQFAPRIVEADWSFHLMLEGKKYLREHAEGTGPCGFVRGTALCTPFSDQAFDLVLSVRLCHHISDHDERLDYLKEILRISQHSVVFTYFDSNTLKNRIYDLKRRIVPKQPKRTLSLNEVTDIARTAGFDIIQSVPLSRLFSGHRYTVLQRRV